MQTLKYRPFEHDDWGMIRNPDGSMFATVRRPCSKEELAEHRANGTDPFEDIALKLIAAVTRPAATVDNADTWTDDELWQIVNEFDDRTSPEEYPEMIMLNEAEFRDFLDRGRASLKADNAELAVQLAKTESHVEAVKNTLGVRCAEVSLLEERCKMLENELSAPEGYRVIPKQPTDTMLQVMAFNLCAEFGGEFTIANKAFAMAVYKQAWELGVRSERQPSQRAPALEEAARIAEAYTGGEHEAQGRAAEEIAIELRALSSLPVAAGSAAASDVLGERRRQIEVEGWMPEHDDRWVNGELADAAAGYAHHAALKDSLRRICIPMTWPWGRDWWKPADRRRNLVKAGALILAEIDRLDRLPASPGESK